MNSFPSILLHTGPNLRRAFLVPSYNLVAISSLRRPRRGLLQFSLLYPRTAYNRSISISSRRYLRATAVASKTTTDDTERKTNGKTGIAHEGPMIELTEKEEKIREILLATADEINAEKQNESEHTVLRITGGWVRDKLLNGVSNDIDIGINNMTGFDFASKLNQMLEREKDKYGIDARSIHKIKSNPERSKHLETTTTKVIDLFVDFVNLRSESYSAESRIPQMEFGTPKEDALRRDATVNALFYNLHTQKVEDFTESGLQDLEKKVIRTPLAPFETFSDDPLRVLRLIRFASRLQFQIVEEVQEAMANEEIKKALKMKISRERVGVEVEKMLKGANPFGSITFFHTLGFFDAVFSPPQLQLKSEKPREHLIVAATELKFLQDPKAKERFPHIGRLLGDKIEEQYIAWVLCCLAPWAGQTTQEKSKTLPTAAVAARDALKMTTKQITTIEKCFANYESVQSTTNTNIATPLSRSQTGLAIRKWGADWRLQVLCSLLLDLIPHWNLNSETQGEKVEKILQPYEELLKRVSEFGLEDAMDLKYLVNGKVLSKTLGRKPGPWTGDAMDLIIEWQLDHPDGTQEEVLEYIVSKKDTF